MKKNALLILVLSAFLSACAGTGYNTQKGAAIGAGVGALAGQAIGHDTEATLIGPGAGTLLGAIAGNAVDQKVTNQRLNQQTFSVQRAPAFGSHCR